MTIRNGFFKDIVFLGSFPIVIPIVNLIANLDHEGVELSCWNFLWQISAPKDTIKTLSRHVWMFLTKIDTPYPPPLLLSTFIELEFNNNNLFFYN